MRFQSTAASCGPACLRNALLCHGVIRSEAELETLTGCTATDGTSPKGILRALASISQEHPQVKPGVISESRPDVAILKLVAALTSGHVVIMCVDNEDHWVVGFGLLGSGASVTIHVSDPADSEMVEHMAPSDLLRRWEGQGRKPYFGVIV